MIVVSHYCLFMLPCSKVVVITLLLPPARRLPLLAAVHVHGVLVLLCSGRRIGNLGNDVAQKVELRVVCNGLLQVDGADAL